MSTKYSTDILLKTRAISQKRWVKENLDFASSKTAQLLNQTKIIIGIEASEFLERILPMSSIGLKDGKYRPRAYNFIETPRMNKMLQHCEEWRKKVRGNVIFIVAVGEIETIFFDSSNEQIDRPSRKLFIPKAPLFEIKKDEISFQEMWDISEGYMLIASQDLTFGLSVTRLLDESCAGSYLFEIAQWLEEKYNRQF